MSGIGVPVAAAQSTALALALAPLASTSNNSSSASFVFDSSDHNSWTWTWTWSETSFSDLDPMLLSDNELWVQQQHQNQRRWFQNQHYSQRHQSWQGWGWWGWYQGQQGQGWSSLSSNTTNSSLSLFTNLNSSGSASQIQWSLGSSSSNQLQWPGIFNNSSSANANCANSTFTNSSSMRSASRTQSRLGLGTSSGGKGWARSRTWSRTRTRSGTGSGSGSGLCSGYGSGSALGSGFGSGQQQGPLWQVAPSSSSEMDGNKNNSNIKNGFGSMNNNYTMGLNSVLGGGQGQGQATDSGVLAVGTNSGARFSLPSIMTSQGSWSSSNLIFNFQSQSSDPEAVNWQWQASQYQYFDQDYEYSSNSGGISSGLDWGQGLGRDRGSARSATGMGTVGFLSNLNFSNATSSIEDESGTRTGQYGNFNQNQNEYTTTCDENGQYYNLNFQDDTVDNQKQNNKSWSWDHNYDTKGNYVQGQAYEFGDAQQSEEQKNWPGKWKSKHTSLRFWIPKPKSSSSSAWLWQQGSQLETQTDDSVAQDWDYNDITASWQQWWAAANSKSKQRLGLFVGSSNQNSNSKFRVCIIVALIIWGVILIFGWVAAFFCCFMQHTWETASLELKLWMWNQQVQNQKNANAKIWGASRNQWPQSPNALSQSEYQIIADQFYNDQNNNSLQSSLQNQNQDNYMINFAALAQQNPSTPLYIEPEHGFDDQGDPVYSKGQQDFLAMMIKTDDSGMNRDSLDGGKPFICSMQAVTVSVTGGVRNKIQTPSPSQRNMQMQSSNQQSLSSTASTSSTTGLYQLCGEGEGNPTHSKVARAMALGGKQGIIQRWRGQPIDYSWIQWQQSYQQQENQQYQQWLQEWQNEFQQQNVNFAAGSSAPWEANQYDQNNAASLCGAGQIDTAVCGLAIGAGTVTSVWGVSRFLEYQESKWQQKGATLDWEKVHQLCVSYFDVSDQAVRQYGDIVLKPISQSKSAHSQTTDIPAVPYNAVVNFGTAQQGPYPAEKNAALTVMQSPYYGDDKHQVQRMKAMVQQIELAKSGKSKKKGQKSSSGWSSKDGGSGSGSDGDEQEQPYSLLGQAQDFLTGKWEEKWEAVGEKIDEKFDEKIDEKLEAIDTALEMEVSNRMIKVNQDIEGFRGDGQHSVAGSGHKTIGSSSTSDSELESSDHDNNNTHTNNQSTQHERNKAKLMNDTANMAVQNLSRSGVLKGIGMEHLLHKKNQTLSQFLDERKWVVLHKAAWEDAVYWEGLRRGLIGWGSKEEQEQEWQQNQKQQSEEKKQKGEGESGYRVGRGYSTSFRHRLPGDWGSVILPPGSSSHSSSGGRGRGKKGSRSSSSKNKDGDNSKSNNNPNSNQGQGTNWNPQLGQVWQPKQNTTSDWLDFFKKVWWTWFWTVASFIGEEMAVQWCTYVMLSAGREMKRRWAIKKQKRIQKSIRFKEDSAWQRGEWAKWREWLRRAGEKAKKREVIENWKFKQEIAGGNGQKKQFKNSGVQKKVNGKWQQQQFDDSIQLQVADDIDGVKPQDFERAALEEAIRTRVRAVLEFDPFNPKVVGSAIGKTALDLMTPQGRENATKARKAVETVLKEAYEVHGYNSLERSQYTSLAGYNSAYNTRGPDLMMEKSSPNYFFNKIYNEEIMKPALLQSDKIQEKTAELKYDGNTGAVTLFDKSTKTGVELFGKGEQVYPEAYMDYEYTLSDVSRVAKKGLH